MKTGFSEHDKELVKSIFEKMYLNELREGKAIEFVASINNITFDYVKSIFNSYKNMRRMT